MCFLGLLLIGGPALAQEPEPVGEEFQVNSYTTSRQLFPVVAADAQGNFVVVWESDGSYDTDTSFYSVQAQLYDGTGTPVGSQLQVNSSTTNGQWRTAVAADAQGNFVVVWQSNVSSGDDTDVSIQAQLYDASGSPQGGEFQVNSYTTGVQSYPAIGVRPGGGFLVVWESSGSGGNDQFATSIQGRRFDASGSPQGSDFQVNTYTFGIQGSAALVFGPSGEFVVVWDSSESGGTDTSNWSIQGRRFAANGSPQGDDFQVNSYTTGYQGQPAVAADAQGSFAVVWESAGSYGNDTSQSSVQAQLYDASGIRVGGEFQINSYTTNGQRQPAVALDALGKFVVTWASDGSSGTDTSSYSVQGQHYDEAWNALGGQFQVNTYITSFQYRPSIAAGANGDFVVVWSSPGSTGTDTDSYSIQGQRFSTSIFVDGFESGDTFSWSATVP